MMKNISKKTLRLQGFLNIEKFITKNYLLEREPNLPLAHVRYDS